MQLLMEILVSFFLIIGAFFMLVGGIGMVRLPDLFATACPYKIQHFRTGKFLNCSHYLCGI
jgi:multicomponent K+:H+ antiporter subunit G